MHVPDGFINAPISVTTGVVAAAGVAYCLRRGAQDLDERITPLAGLTAGFVFAAQMLNFPVALGTSGHLLGGVLAAVLVGPWVGAASVAVVLLIQALLFADGGLTALGVNITNMALVTVLAGYPAFLLLRRVLPRRPASIPLAAGVAAGLSVPVSSLAFVAEFALGGTAELPLGGVTAAMVGVHLLIGIGEGILTALTVGAVMNTRPDLVYGARGSSPELELRTAPARAGGAG